MLGRTEPLDVIAPAQTKRFINAALENSDSSLSYPLNFIDSEEPNFCWKDQDFEVTNVALSHRVPCRAYVFTEQNIERQLLQDKLKEDGIEPGPDWGKLQNGNNVTLESGRLLRAYDYTQIPRVARRLVGIKEPAELLPIFTVIGDSHVPLHDISTFGLLR